MHRRASTPRSIAGRAPRWIAFLAALLPIAAIAGPVNINTADAPTLARELKGIGLARAQAIVDYRQKNGPFKTADELAQVKGIGTRVIDANRANIKVEKSDKAPASAAVAQSKDQSKDDKGKNKPADKAPPKDD